MMACNDMFPGVGGNSDEGGGGQGHLQPPCLKTMNKNCLFSCDDDSGRNENIRTHIHIHIVFTLMIFLVRLNMCYF